MKLKSGEKLGVQFRNLEFDTKSLNEEERTVELTISSNTPYSRWFGTEILDHRAEAIMASRLSEGAPLLFNHDRNAHLGRIISHSTDGNKLTVKAKFSKSAFAQEKMQDVKDGILRESSVGYIVHKFEVDEDEETYTATKWEPLEGSLVTIPADTTVGVGRDAEETFSVEVQKRQLTGKPNSETTPKTNAMPDETTPSGSPAIRSEADIIREAEARAEARAEAEQARKDQVKALAERFPRWVDNETRDTFLRTKGRPVSELQAIILEKQGAQPVEIAGPKGAGGEGMKQKDIERYSLVRAINLLATEQRLDGIEKEMSDEAAKRNKRSVSGLGFFIPHDVMYARTLFATGSFASAGALVQTGPQGQSMIELYRNKMRVVEMGAQVLGGLVGDLAIPRQTGGATAYWLAEDATVTASNQTVGQLTMVPHRLAAYTAFSRQLTSQSSIDVENFVRNDLMKVLAIEKDRAALLGKGGAGEPRGVYYTSDLATTVDITATASITYAEAVQFETNVAANNADEGSLGYITSVFIRGTARITPKFANTGMPLWDGEMLANHKARATNQLTATPSVIFGNWNDMIIGDWVSPEVIVDPYSLATANQIRVVVNQLTDIGIRHSKSFCYGVV